ncbi:MAG TPA: hypothetical protein VFA34_01975 [Actinomycetota bacterium]|jgi:hypothetical protein|nr:hypothetical protein [Actinomycetota bacterium]
MLAKQRGDGMEDTRTQDLTQTQPLQTIAAPARPRLRRADRLLRTVVFGIALVVGIATVVVIAGDDGVEAPSPSGIFSPSGHLPSTPNGNKNVSISWSAVDGADGYWWAMVEDPARLPAPAIRPSGNDRRVFFRFSGRGYFVLRAGFRADGKINWSQEVLYGPIVVRDKALPGVEGATTSPGSAPRGADTSGADGSSRSGIGGPGGSSGSSSRPEATVDPRYAGQAGGQGTGNGQSGGPGQPGQPAQQPGGGSSNCTDCPGTDGPQGADGPPGPP